MHSLGDLYYLTSILVCLLSKSVCKDLKLVFSFLKKKFVKIFFFYQYMDKYIRNISSAG